MAKIENDMYYTPIHLANYCWDKVSDIIKILRLMKSLKFLLLLTGKNILNVSP